MRDADELINLRHYIFRFISRSRELQKEKDTSLGGTSERLAEHLQAAFKTGLDRARSSSVCILCGFN